MKTKRHIPAFNKISICFILKYKTAETVAVMKMTRAIPAAKSKLRSEAVLHLYEIFIHNKKHPELVYKNFRKNTMKNSKLTQKIEYNGKLFKIS